MGTINAAMPLLLRIFSAISDYCTEDAPGVVRRHNSILRCQTEITRTDGFGGTFAGFQNLFALATFDLVTCDSRSLARPQREITDRHVRADGASDDM